MQVDQLIKFRELMSDLGWGEPSRNAMYRMMRMASKRGYITLADIAWWGEWQLDLMDWVAYAFVGRPRHQHESAIDLVRPHFLAKKVPPELFLSKMATMMRKGLNAAS